MKWGNLKEGKCPKCGKWLQQGEGKIIYKCPPHFMITHEKYNLLIDAPHLLFRKGREALPDEAEANLSALNNL